MGAFFGANNPIVVQQNLFVCLLAVLGSNLSGSSSGRRMDCFPTAIECRECLRLPGEEPGGEVFIRVPKYGLYVPRQARRAGGGLCCVSASEANGGGGIGRWKGKNRGMDCSLQRPVSVSHSRPREWEISACCSPPRRRDCESMVTPTTSCRVHRSSVFI